MVRKSFKIAQKARFKAGKRRRTATTARDHEMATHLEEIADNAQGQRGMNRRGKN